MEKKNITRTKAFLLAAASTLTFLTGCHKQNTDSNIGNEENTNTYVVNTHSGLYDSEYSEHFEVAKLKSDSKLYDSNLMVVRVTTNEEDVCVYFMNDTYAIINDLNGERYVVNKGDLTIVPSFDVDYYGFILNDAPVYVEPMTYSFLTTDEVIERNQMVLVKKEFDQKLYILDEFGRAKIIRRMDLQRLPDKFITIDISDQTIKLYQNNHVVIEGSVVTGKAAGDDATPTYEGYFEINSNKTRNKTLKDGAQVEYWLPFINDLFGIHDASWRYGHFGDNIYITNGSHGCVNTSYDIAEYLYNNTQVGTKVLIHK